MTFSHIGLSFDMSESVPQEKRQLAKELESAKFDFMEEVKEAIRPFIGEKMDVYVSYYWSDDDRGAWFQMETYVEDEAED